MNILDSLTFILAIWGAILSTVLGLIIIREYSRNLKIHLDWRAFYERCHLVIGINGCRPKPLNELLLRVLKMNGLVLPFGRGGREETSFEISIPR